MTDLEIQNQYVMKNIKKVAKKFGILNKDMILYGDKKAKLNKLPMGNKKGKLVLVTATNPTKYGEGKTTVSIGLSDALNILKKKSVLALREPSLGPVFGIKGGATGGGYSQIVPMEDINFHFTGDFHAITSANNLLCSLIDNSIYFENPLNINPESVNFHRCLDINDRALRNIGLKVENNYERYEKFNITSASEMMGIMTTAKNIEDLKQKIGNICIGFNDDNKPVYARELHCEDAIAILLKDALKPNLVQTLGGNLALVHLGPFANISHGCNSAIATESALKIGDYCVTEAGFGADLGAEKFIDFMSSQINCLPNVVVLTTTLRSLKYNGGEYENVEKPNMMALKNGLPILLHHCNNIKNKFKANLVVALNKFSFDTVEELDYVVSELKNRDISVAVCEPYTKGGKGCIELAKLVVSESNKPNNCCTIYSKTDTLKTKIEKVVKNIYGATKVIYSDLAKEKLNLIKKNKLDNLPIIVAKTQYSLSDDPKKIGVVSNFDFTITDFEINSGAGYIVAIAGKMLLMPGLSKTPNAINMTINNNELITGLF